MGGEAARHEDGRQYPAAQDQYGRGPWRQVRPLRKPPRNGGGIRLHPLAVRRRGSMKAASSPRCALRLAKPDSSARLPAVDGTLTFFQEDRGFERRSPNGGSETMLPTN